MSSLRDLLDYADASSIPSATVFGESGYQFSFRGMQCGQGSGQDSYEGQQICWCVPNNLNICKLRVEIWGGGGNGSGVRCNSMGVPGYAGEYNSRILCADEVGVNCFDGQCYYAYVSVPGCCANCYGACFGCKSYVDGPGLSNFCAEGGYGGFGEGICYGHQCSYYVCCTRIGNNCWSNCGCTPAYCCWHENTCAPQDVDARKEYEEKGTCYNGIVASYRQIDYDCRSMSFKKFYTPLPGGLVGKYGTYLAHQTPCSDCYYGACWFCNERYRFNNAPGVMPGLGNSCQFGGVPGMGGGTGDLGCCYYCFCSGTGGSGAVRFTMFPNTSA